MPKQKIDLQPQVLDLILYAGDGTKFRLVVTNSAGQPVNLTGSMKAHVRVMHEDPDPAATFEIGLTQAAQGIAEVVLPGDQTQPLATNDKFTGMWDLEWTATGEEPVTLCQGKVEIHPDVSR